MQLSTLISHIPYIGEVYAKRLVKLGIETVDDLLHHYPARYIDFSLVSLISQSQAGEKATIQGIVVSCTNQYTRNRMTIQKAIITDYSGMIEATWFNQPFLEQTLVKGKKINLSGTIDFFRGKPVLTSPEFEIINYSSNQSASGQHLQPPFHTGRLVPLYHETYGISSKWLRNRIVYILNNLPSIPEILPESVIEDNNLISLTDALYAIHFPASTAHAESARKRLAFDEIFITQLASRIRIDSWKKEHTPYLFPIDSSITNSFKKILPFALTNAQEQALSDITLDLSRDKPMNRLLQGDVGSGKTAVAAGAMFRVCKGNCQSVLMAPTEILARQHFETIHKLFQPLHIPVAFVTGSVKKRTGNEPIIIGTHALLYNQRFNNLALVVIDEQHRFGVEQRSKLQERGLHPHLLSTTATPIPRSVALVLYSELSLSYLDEVPKGRIPVKTWLVPNEKRQNAYEWIKKQLRPVHISHGSISKNPQAFIICPLIEESEHETMTTVKAVTKEYLQLTRIFSEYTVGLLHGKLKSTQKKEILDRFSNGSIDVLIATPVVEVGIDIPNATIMLIEAAERFGLSQLHQLRGRIGRGDMQSYCLLFTESTNETTLKRLKSMETLKSGAALAELDLKLRGPGEMYGIRQHGFSTFKLASFSDTPLIALAGKAAEKVFTAPEYFNTEALQKKLKSYTIHTVTNN